MPPSPERDIMPHYNLAGSVAEIESKGARDKLEHDATYLIRQIDAIEMNKKDLVSQTSALEVDDTETTEASSGMTKINAFDSNGRNGIVSPLPATPSPSSRPALADDLSTLNEDGTPARP